MRLLSSSCFVFLTALCFVAGCGYTESEPGEPSVTEPVALNERATVDSSTDTIPAVPPTATPPDATRPPVAALSIGDPAPPLGVTEWLKGDPVESFEEGQVYVVEFWATWCGPCRTSMPHISQLQEQLGDKVTFMGISDEDKPTVDGFMAGVQDSATGATWNEVVKYRIGIDPGRTTQANYMEAAGQSGIPTAFIVGRDRHLEWIGHPMEMDEPLAKIVAGDWDRDEGIAAARLDEQIRQGSRSGELVPLLAQVDDFLTKYPDHARFRLVKFQLLLHIERFDAATTAADELAESYWDDGEKLNQVAWLLAKTPIPSVHRDLEQALRIGLRASSLQGDTDASSLDTVAFIYSEQRNVDEAIKWQKKAVENAPDDRQIRRTLQEYEAKK